MNDTTNVIKVLNTICCTALIVISSLFILGFIILGAMGLGARFY